MSKEDVDGIEQQVQLGWKVPVAAKENFATFCNEVGAVIQEDCAGALTVWPYLPAEIREQAKLAAKGLGEVDAGFWEDYQAGLRTALRAQANSLQGKRGKKK